MKRRLLSLMLLGAAALSLSACSVWRGDADAREAEAQTVFPYVRLAPSPPPPVQIEAMPITNEPMKQVWRRGYWSYDGQNFNWVAGHFLLRPDATAFWSPDRWERRSFGWAFIPGSWQ